MLSPTGWGAGSVYKSKTSLNVKVLDFRQVVVGQSVLYCELSGGRSRFEAVDFVVNSTNRTQPYLVSQPGLDISAFPTP